MLRRLILSSFIACCILPTASAKPVQLKYVCEIEGAPATLEIALEVLAGNAFYGGELKTATTRYSIRGQDEYADFASLETPERFRAKLESNGEALKLIVDPFGTAPTEHQCQKAS